MTTALKPWPYPRWVAHRGAGKLAPENTLSAFRLGALHGYRFFECDAKLRGQTRLEIQKLHAELGITSLFVTHDQVEAMTLAQRMVVMNGGYVEQFGTPEEVYHTPASTFVAGFIGSPPMNLLKSSPNGKPGQILGIRPEHLDLVETGGLEFKVHTVELLGAERLLYGKVGDEDVTVRVEEGKPFPKPGETARIAAREDRLHWFNAETGKRA